MNQSVIVLMSTYNGQKYLKEQIESIYNQDFSGHITVVIRDDGSKDNTLKIISEFVPTADRAVQLIAEQNIGPQKSFLELIRRVPQADFYCFADQDDVWDADKVSVAVKALAQEGESPACYCSNYRLTDMNLQVYRPKAIAETPKFTPLKTLLYNRIPGCVMVFNRALMGLLQKVELEDVMMHDSMVMCLASYCGKVIFDPTPRISHRIHLDNVVGDGHKKIIPHKWIVEKVKLVCKKEHYDLSKMAEQLLAVAPAVSPAYHRDMCLLRDFKKSGKDTRALLRHPDTQGKRFGRTTMSIRCKIWMHLF